jgi:hypothetical protein
MNNKKNPTFAEKALNYIVCYNEQCPLHTKCLRYDVGQYVPAGQLLVTSVSPAYEHALDGNCTLFSDNTPVTMKVGMKNRFYMDMPAYIATKIKGRLIAHTCRSTYYKYHNGKRPIPPTLLSFIESVCREEGWTGPLVFDGEVKDYVW